MPYSIKKKNKGYKVCVQSGKCFSKKPMSRKKALKQLAAIKINTNEGLSFKTIVLQVLSDFT